MGYYYRSFIKTANEKRQVESSKEEEHPIKIRSRRNVYRLNLVKGTKDRDTNHFKSGECDVQ